MKTGEIWLARLDPTTGSEIQKTRPCVVISPDEMNDHLRTVIVAPMTTGSRPAGFRIPLTFQGKQGLIVLDQIRTLDRVRLTQRLGSLRPSTLAATLRTLQAMFAPVDVTSRRG
jgi:mRNA interferase MazF